MNDCKEKKISALIQELEDYLLSFKQKNNIKNAAKADLFGKVENLLGQAKVLTDIGTPITDVFDGLSHGQHTIHVLSGGLHAGSSLLTILNFLKTPAEHLYAWVQGESVKDSYSKNARWIQSAMVLSLALLTLAIPAGGPAFGLGAVFIGLGASVISLANLFFNKQILQDKLKKITKEIETAEQRMRHEVSDLLQGVLDSLETDSPETTPALYFEGISAQVNVHREKLLNLHAKKLEIEKGLSKSGPVAVMDRAFSISISLLMIIAFTLILTTNPAGAGLITVAALLSSVYLLGRVAPSFFRKTSQWLGKLIKSSPAQDPVDKEVENKTVEKNHLAQIEGQAVVTPFVTKKTGAANENGQSNGSVHTFFKPQPQTADEASPQEITHKLAPKP